VILDTDCINFEISVTIFYLELEAEEKLCNLAEPLFLLKFHSKLLTSYLLIACAISVGFIQYSFSPCKEPLEPGAG
jgi:hypothetical protein